tara:strand:- start:9048 stop:9455 length:408 start_codon:yes stop_codon:yes gene_type:complete
MCGLGKVVGTFPLFLIKYDKKPLYFFRYFINYRSNYFSNEGRIPWIKLILIHKHLNKKKIIMESVIKYVTGFFGGLLSVMMAVLPLTIVWFVLTGGAIFNMDVVTNLTALITSLGEGGFVGLVVLVMLASFFVKK